MSSHGRSEPKRRPGKTHEKVQVDKPVRVSKTDGDTVLGVVKSIHSIEGHYSVCVATAGGELVTAQDRVEVVAGVDAKQARQEASRGDNG